MNKIKHNKLLKSDCGKLSPCLHKDANKPPIHRNRLAMRYAKGVIMIVRIGFIILCYFFSGNALSEEVKASFNYGKKTNICRDLAMDAGYAYGGYIWTMKEFDLLKADYKDTSERYRHFQDASEFKKNLLSKELSPLTDIYRNAFCPKEGLLFTFSCVSEVIKSINSTPVNYLELIDKACIDKIGRYIYESYASQTQ